MQVFEIYGKPKHKYSLGFNTQDQIKALAGSTKKRDIKGYLVLFPICPIKFSNLSGFNRLFLPVEMSDSLQKAYFPKPAKKSDNNKQDSPLFSFLPMMTLGCVHVFRPLGRMDFPFVS